MNKLELLRIWAMQQYRMAHQRTLVEAKTDASDQERLLWHINIRDALIEERTHLEFLQEIDRIEKENP